MTTTSKGAALDPATHTSESAAATGGTRAEIEPAQNSRPNSHLVKHQFKPGVSGNPGGRPKGIVAKALTKELRRKIARSDESVLEAYVRKYVDQALKECDAARFASIRDTVDGRPGADDSNRTNIGTINIQWNRPIPAWAQLAEPVPSQPEPCAIDVGKVQWAQPPESDGSSDSGKGTLAERVGRNDARSRDSGNQQQIAPVKKSNCGFG